MAGPSDRILYEPLYTSEASISESDFSDESDIVSSNINMDEITIGRILFLLCSRCTRMVMIDYDIATSRSSGMDILLNDDYTISLTICKNCKSITPYHIIPDIEMGMLISPSFIISSDAYKLAASHCVYRPIVLQRDGYVEYVSVNAILNTLTSQCKIQSIDMSSGHAIGYLEGGFF